MRIGGRTIAGTAAAILVIAAAGAQSAAPPPEAGADWPMYNKDYSGQRYSALTDLTPATVDRLTEACRVKIATGGSLQAGPVVVDGTMYVTAELRTMAIDAKDCSVRWTYDHRLEAPAVFPVNRGVALLNGRLFRGTSDGRLLALDAQTGHLLWKDVVGEPESGEYLAGAPLAWNGLVIIGIAGSEFGVKGRIMAFEAESGREVWRFDTIPTGKDIGADSWKNADAARTGGGGSWTTFSLDPKSEELFVPVGNPTPDFDAAARPGDDLFTNCLVVLDARTGALKWWYQIDPHDTADLDLAAAPTLYRNGSQREVVAIAAKDGWLRVIDRETHKPLLKLATTTIQDEGKLPTPEGVHMCPGAFGGTEWNGVAFDRQRKMLVVGSVDWCSVFVLHPQPFVAGKMYFGGSFHADKDASGWVVAADADTGALRWKFHAATPVVAAVTPTAGGVTLAGDNGGELLMLSSDNGELLRKIDTGGALAGGIVTYQLDGKQYVAIDSGNVSRTGYGALGDPTIVIYRVDTSTVVAGRDNPEAGRAVFAVRCASCHAGDGSGVPGHALHDFKGHASFDVIVGKIENPNPPMPKLFPSPLSEQDVRNLAAYIETSL